MTQQATNKLQARQEAQRLYNHYTQLAKCRDWARSSAEFNHYDTKATSAYLTWKLYNIKNNINKSEI